MSLKFLRRFLRRRDYSNTKRFKKLRSLLLSVSSIGILLNFSHRSLIQLSNSISFRLASQLGFRYFRSNVFVLGCFRFSLSLSMFSWFIFIVYLCMHRLRDVSNLSSVDQDWF